eukprot:12302096-Alexandrium_andersonii.AAC.1
MAQCPGAHAAPFERARNLRTESKWTGAPLEIAVGLPDMHCKRLTMACQPAAHDGPHASTPVPTGAAT